MQISEIADYLKIMQKLKRQTSQNKSGGRIKNFTCAGAAGQGNRLCRQVWPGRPRKWFHSDIGKWVSGQKKKAGDPNGWQTGPANRGAEVFRFGLFPISVLRIIRRRAKD